MMPRFTAKFAIQPNGCWQWMTSLDAYGYGTFRIDRRMVKAHRYAYEQLVGPIPEGLVIDHLCRNRSCVNPAHMEPVTRWENTRRGVGWTAEQVRKAECVNGHPFSDANTRRSGNRRACRACNVEAAARYRARKASV